ncbi:hypothetical protein VCRA2114E365_150039 [Vibrio crassostreae]|nr:hypothetical protein VCRA2115O371_130081 [Vibrio crassostreae]CAK1759001.1 hypothetical protein VCRA2113O351_140039 [Vibrio crassostreae]CAK1768326.1 hypothetical protein VCRA2114O369_140082 [Vibrio crassostreae]CAK1769100.1 hypothetical protein VCRA2113O362_140082 [Vibrio crassostreae]CAK1769871.1 hypothetical protein VCRA2113O199_140082 [Vibrio crassostreae]
MKGFGSSYRQEAELALNQILVYVGSRRISKAPPPIGPIC